MNSKEVNGKELVAKLHEKFPGCRHGNNNPNNRKLAKHLGLPENKINLINKDEPLSATKVVGLIASVFHSACKAATVTNAKVAHAEAKAAHAEAEAAHAKAAEAHAEVEAALAKAAAAHAKAVGNANA